MTELALNFDFSGAIVRTISKSLDDIWFIGKDVAIALGHSNPERAVREYVEPEDKGVTDIVTPGGKQQVTLINEPGVYSLVFASQTEHAKKFKRWVTHEVLPSIRKQGYYSLYSDEDTLKLIMEKVERQLTETSLIPFDQRTTILDKINKTQIKSEIKAKIKEQKYKLIQELWKSDFVSTDATEFMHKLQSICNGDTKLFHKYWDLYNQQKNPKFRGVVMV